jgi:hypothetical protein
LPRGAAYGGYGSPPFMGKDAAGARGS